MLTRDQILAVRDLPTEVVDVPEWGDTVIIAVMSGKAREQLMDALADPQGPSRFQAIILASTMVDETGARMFGEDDIEQLREKNPDVLTRLVDVAMRLNKIGPKATEDAVKNSEAAPSGSSGSDSLAS
jgi:hypothetical protein